MKNFFTACILFFIFSTNLYASVPWWLQPTICRLDPTDCYAAMGAGFYTEMWDATSECWGLKLICPDALIEKVDEPIPVGKRDINNSRVINNDYDTNLLSLTGDCFGRRKTIEDGTKVSINGKYVNVWCFGILDKSDETTANGEIVYGTQPTCSNLAKNGYIAVKNNRCFGKYFDASQYYIECGDELLPERIIVLNGADYNTPLGNAPATKKDAERKFDTMYSVSQDQKEKYFAN